MTDQTYEPGDSRNITLKKESGPIEPPRTGPRVEESRESESDSERQKGGAQAGYGNSRDEEGASEKDMRD